jgi:tetratricopeptide (TPR) repeat protein
MLVGYLVLVALLGRCFGSQTVSAACLAAAGIALLTHLLGSGGIEMPAIAQTLVLLPCLVGPAGRDSGTIRCEIPTTGGGRCVFVLAAAALVLFITCLWTATSPVIRSRALVARGEDAQRRGNLELAKLLYREASVQDPFSPRPVERLARVWVDRSLSLRQFDDGSFEKAVELQQLAIKLDPHEFLLQAVERYPASSVLRAELAEALVAAGRSSEARKQAEMALELDHVNRREGHSDKYLPQDALQRVERISMSP